MHNDKNSSPLTAMSGTLLAGLGAAALVFAPMQAHADTAAPSEDGTSADNESTLGPDGYKSLELGQSEEEALATDLITDRQQIGDCTWYNLKKSEGEQNPGSGVVISPDRGVVNIPGTQSLNTPEGITMGSVNNDKGSTTEQIENAYDRYTVDKTGPVPIYTAPAPGNSKAHYIFAIGEDDKVKDLGLTSDDDGGCGLND
ncbi:hypothetical protein [Brevibacterium pigmentatum]|uniref:hypothetical protein n=1 Tax=Brevibacterium pigmentatum TaxID=1496080 RepID=UPI0014214F81|nr:hypothetical protein [Brevibacterium pigmentatum]